MERTLDTQKEKWKSIKSELEKRKESPYEIRLCQIMFEAGWEVKPESGYRFRKSYIYSDGSGHVNMISKKDARLIVVLAEEIKE